MPVSFGLFYSVFSISLLVGLNEIQWNVSLSVGYTPVLAWMRLLLTAFTRAW
jgi:hypothetical protein